MKKTLVTTLSTGALLIVMSACSSTVTLGPKANENAVVGASVGSDGATVTVPLVSATVAPSETTTAPTEATKPNKK